MKQKIQLIKDKINTYELRERALITLSIWAMIILLVWLPLFIDPLTLESGNTEKQILQLEQTNKTLNAQRQATIDNMQTNPDKKRLELITNDIAKLENEISISVGGTIPPAEMAEVLEKIFVENTQLELIQFKTMQATPLILSENAEMQDEESSTEGNNIAALYKHGFQIEFRGDYMATLEYLEAIENLQYELYWEMIDITMDVYPKAIVKINVYSLSMNKDWIGV